MVMDFEDWEPDYDLCMREDWPGLVRYRERVARRAPDNLYAQGRLGEAYVLNGEYERAIEFLSKLYHEHPYYTDAEHYLLGGAGVLAMFLALFASAPSAAVGRKVVGEERRGMSLQKMIEQANLPVAAGEFLRIGALLAVATAVVGYVLLRTATGAILGAMIGPLAYWGYLGSKRDKTRRSYQEALARVATILRDVIGRGGSLNEGIIAVALRGPTVVREDFEEVRTLLGTGRTPEEALEPMGERRRDPVLTMLVEILLVHREHGSGVKAVLDRLAAAARRRANVRKRILAEQAQLRWEARIVSIAPFPTTPLPRVRSRCCWPG
jgi:Flp pilus assembly protein TadB